MKVQDKKEVKIRLDEADSRRNLKYYHRKEVLQWHIAETMYSPLQVMRHDA